VERRRARSRTATEGRAAHVVSRRPAETVRIARASIANATSTCGRAAGCRSTPKTASSWFCAGGIEPHGFWPDSHDLNRHWAERRGGEALRRFQQFRLSASSVVHHFGTVQAGVDAAKRDKSVGRALDLGN
jgi:hypothetical protein